MVSVLRQALRVGQYLHGDILVRLQQAAFDLVTGALSDKDNFEALVDLADLETDLFAPPRRCLESWAEEFESFLDIERYRLVYGEDDPDWLEAEMRDISSIADAMGVDVVDLEYLVDERIDELRSEQEDYEMDDLPDVDDSRDDSTTEDEENEIDALFHSLT